MVQVALLGTPEPVIEGTVLVADAAVTVPPLNVTPPDKVNGNALDTLAAPLDPVWSITNVWVGFEPEPEIFRNLIKSCCEAAPSQ
jgi:hypothetical protein